MSNGGAEGFIETDLEQDQAELYSIRQVPGSASPAADRKRLPPILYGPRAVLPMHVNADIVANSYTK